MQRGSHGLLAFGILAGMLGGASYYAHQASSQSFVDDFVVEDVDVVAHNESVTEPDSRNAMQDNDSLNVSDKSNFIEDDAPRIELSTVIAEETPIDPGVSTLARNLSEAPSHDDLGGTLIASVSDDESDETDSDSNEPIPTPKWLCEHFDWNQFQSMQATTGFVESILGGCVYRLTNVTVTGPDNVTVATLTSEIFDLLTKKIIVRRVETKLRSEKKLLQFTITEDLFDIKTGDFLYSRRFADDEESPKADSDDWEVVSGPVSP